MLARAITYACFLLYLTLGATFNGIVQPQTRLLGLLGVIAIGGAWLVARRRWRSTSTVLDGAFLLWAVALSASLLANTDQARRILMGAWYVGAYLLLWLLLHDLLANRLITRRVLMNALLLSGVLIVAFGYLQTRTWFTSMLPLMLNGAVDFSLPRPVSTLGNANTLGAFLAVLLPLALEATRSSKGIGRGLLALYVLLIGGLLGLTYSRGAWVGAAAGVGLYVVLLLWRAGWLAPKRWRAVWSTQNTLRRSLIVAVLLMVFGVAALGSFLVARSILSPGGRSLDTRTWIYETAWQTFREQPLTGSGLFTFGTDLARFNGNPPREPHAHAHNLLLHVAAELGALGLLALAVSAGLIVRTLVQNARRDPVIIAGAGGVMAFAGHHLFDVPSLNPVIALIGLVALVIAIAPFESVTLVGARRQIMRFAVPIGALVLALTGLWSVSIYQQYVSIITQTAKGELTPLDGARQLQSVVEADSGMALYVYEQGFLYGLAGERQAAIAAFERYTQLDPDYALGWLNLYALYRAAGDLERAGAAIARAHQVSPDEQHITYQLAETQTLLGDIEGARASYQLALITEPDFQMLPTWNADPLRVEVLAATTQTVPTAGSIVRDLRQGDLEAARAGLVYYRAITPSPTSASVFDALFALRADDRAAAELALVTAQAVIQGQGDSAWSAYGAACLARYDGDETAVATALTAAREALILEPFETDWPFGANIGYTQLMRMMIPRVFLPEVGYPVVSPTLSALLETFAAVPETRYSSCP